MNDTMADAVFMEHQRSEGQRNRSGWQQPQPSRPPASRRGLASLLLTLATRLAPAEPITTITQPHAPLA